MYEYASDHLEPARSKKRGVTCFLPKVSAWRLIIIALFERL